jgi:ELWxxDGT repeat protein
MENVFYFTAYDKDNPFLELWRSDGTPAGTYLPSVPE